jgi:hypothetical protein
VNGTNTGTYTFWLQKLNGPVGCTAIAYGDGQHAGSIGGPAETDCYRFTGNNHDQARIRLTAGAGVTPLVEVVRPNGSTVCAPTTSLDFTCTLDVNGNHTILVRDLGGTGTGNYTVRVDKL